MEVPFLGGLVFWALALLTVGGAAMVAFSRNIVRSAFSLLGALFGVAGLFAFLSADFVSIVQLMVYVGGVLVLFLFSVMLTGRIDQVNLSNLSRGVLPALLAFVLIVSVLGVIAISYPWSALSPEQALLFEEGTTKPIGHALLSEYLLPFEIASILLVAALIGAVLLANRGFGDHGTKLEQPEGEQS